MRARCYRCQATFDTDHFGVQACPNCAGEIYLPDPAAEPPPAPPPPAPPPPPEGGGAAPPSWSAQPGAQPPPGPGAPAWGTPPPPPPPPPTWSWGPVAPGAVPPAVEYAAPFAERAQRGFVTSFFQTWKLAALEPVRFFRQVRIDQTRSAVLFGLIALTIGEWVSMAFSYLSANATLSCVGQVTSRMGGRIDTKPFVQMLQGYTAGTFLIQFVAAPFILFVLLYLTAAVFHVLLLVVHGAHRGFDATLTVVGYACGIALIRAIPGCGALLAGVWFMVVAIQGLSETQRCGGAKSAFAVLAPLILACAAMCALTAIAGMAGFSFLKGLGGPPPSTSL